MQPKELKAKNFQKELIELLKRYNIEQEDLTSINVIVSVKNGEPAIFLRRITTNHELIMNIVSAAYYNQPLIIIPQFQSTLQGIASCVEKGILYKEDGKYFFTF